MLLKSQLDFSVEIRVHLHQPESLQRKVDLLWATAARKKGKAAEENLHQRKSGLAVHLQAGSEVSQCGRAEWAGTC